MGIDEFGKYFGILFENLEKEKATRILEGGLFAYTMHYGSYKNFPDAYGTLTQWIEDSNYKSAGAPFEIYEESNIVGLPIEKWKTDIYFPVIKK